MPCRGRAWSTATDRNLPEYKTGGACPVSYTHLDVYKRQHIEAGKNLFVNYNCTIIDVAKVTIGDNCQLAPNVAIYTAGHPVYPCLLYTSRCV